MNKQLFEIGLVGAGAISAGAYTGGVIDFMVYALDQWYAAKDNKNEDVPPHDVKISVFSGASAGAITAALATGYLASEQPSIKNEQEGESNNGNNKLFDSWVDRIDIKYLLQRRDLVDANSLIDNNSSVISLLDSTILSEIADSGLNLTPRKQRRTYVAENFQLLLTVTNLRGVPYAFEMQGNQPTSYDMSLHADYVHFCINDSEHEPSPDRYVISWSNFGNSSDVMSKLKLSALASGAFPIGLTPRTLTHQIPGRPKPDWYSSREWIHPQQNVIPMFIQPNWGNISNYTFNFQCVDGGVMNNEPLELARRFLAGSTERNPREGRRANKAMILIDPFPSKSLFDPEYKPEPDILKTAIKLVDALKNQARFKPDELELAADENVYSRFMIAPSRDKETYPIACGSLGGFGGFLKRDFRSHDYFLGRRNAQKFLQDHFVLPEKNPLFDDWTEDMRKEYCVKEDNTTTPKKKNDQRLLPIIPIVEREKKDECYQAEWPEFTQNDLTLLLEQIEDRADIVIDRLVDQYFKSNNPFVRFGAKFFIGHKKKDIVKAAEGKITKDLKNMQLMRDG